MVVRITGDVHGKTADYVRMIKESKVRHSVQLGDMAFDYEKLKDLDCNNHKFFGGNHDNYDIYYKSKHALGDYGAVTLGPLDFFFIRGDFSIDKDVRLRQEAFGMGKGWWREEELTYKKASDAIDMYLEARPKVMITHSCPHNVSLMVGNPVVLKHWGFDPKTFTTSTQTCLQRCFDGHKPDTWIFGHFHRSLDFNYMGTRFICLPELKFIDYENGGFINTNRIEVL